MRVSLLGTNAPRVPTVHIRDYITSRYMYITYLIVDKKSSYYVYHVYISLVINNILLFFIVIQLYIYIYIYIL